MNLVGIFLLLQSAQAEPGLEWKVLDHSLDECIQQDSYFRGPAERSVRGLLDDQGVFLFLGNSRFDLRTCQRLPIFLYEVSVDGRDRITYSPRFHEGDFTGFFHHSNYQAINSTDRLDFAQGASEDGSDLLVRYTPFFNAGWFGFSKVPLKDEELGVTYWSGGFDPSPSPLRIVPDADGSRDLYQYPKSWELRDRLTGKVVRKAKEPHYLSVDFYSSTQDLALGSLTLNGKPCFVIWSRGKRKTVPFPEGEWRPYDSALLPNGTYLVALLRKHVLSGPIFTFDPAKGTWTSIADGYLRARSNNGRYFLVTGESLSEPMTLYRAPR